MANADEITLGYEQESTFATDPGGTRNPVRITSESLKQSSETTTSQELASDRMVPDVVRTSISAEGDINFELTYGTFDDILEAVLLADNDFSSGTVDEITNGTTKRSFTLERKYGDLSLAEKLLGCVFGSFNLSFSPGEIVTGSFSVQGQKAVSVSSPSSFSSPNSNQVMNAVDHIDSFKEAGSSMNITEFSMELVNNLRSRNIVGQVGSNDVRAGRIGLSGTMQKYFSSHSLMDKYLNFNESDFEFVVKDDAGNQYTVTIPKLKFTDGQRVAGGLNTDIIAEMSWEAKKDSSSGNMLKITRTSA